MTCSIACQRLMLRVKGTMTVSAARDLFGTGIGLAAVKSRVRQDSSCPDMCFILQRFQVLH
jgi:hypothetical protein